MILMLKAQCQFCKFSLPVNKHGYNCRRFPPQVKVYYHPDLNGPARENVYPFVSNEDWCGEFSQSEERITHISEIEGSEFIELKAPLPVPEGLDHIPYSHGTFRLPQIYISGIRLHAFKTNLGRVWDTVNGWRDDQTA